MILQELPTDLGGLLWNSLRNVVFWAAASARQRRGVFAPGSAGDRRLDLERIALPGEIADPLHRIADLLADPGVVTITEIGHACSAIAVWAEAADLLGTALAFVQAVVSLSPQDANAAFHAGRLARRRAEGARAESWYRYAVREGRRREDWRAYACGWLGLGNLRLDRGNLPAARHAQLRALRAARRHRLRSEEGAALHNLFAIAAIGGKVQGAQRLALAAARAYGPDHDRLPVLLKDLAFLWTESGCFGQALTLYWIVEHRIRGSSERLLLLSGMARAAAGAAEWEEYERARAATLAKLQESRAHERVAAAWLNLARAATSAGEWERAAGYAEEALRIAVETADNTARFDAEAVLEHARQRNAFAPRGVARRTATEAARTAAQLSTVLSGMT